MFTICLFNIQSKTTDIFFQLCYLFLYLSFTLFNKEIENKIKMFV